MADAHNILFRYIGMGVPNSRGDYVPDCDYPRNYDLVRSGVMNLMEARIGCG